MRNLCLIQYREHRVGLIGILGHRLSRSKHRMWHALRQNESDGVFGTSKGFLRLFLPGVIAAHARPNSSTRNITALEIGNRHKKGRFWSNPKAGGRLYHYCVNYNSMMPRRTAMAIACVRSLAPSLS